MPSPGADDVRQAAALSVAFLSDALGPAWATPVPDLDMSIGGTVAHIAQGCFWYAIDLAAGGDDLGVITPNVDGDGDPAELLQALHTAASVVAAVIETAPTGARGFHPMGLADASGFAAMACDEMLVHTDDIGRALGIDFLPSAELAGRVLGRLFPWVPETDEPWQALRWANGRSEWAGRDRLTDWAWHCAPPDDWDGTVPRR